MPTPFGFHRLSMNEKFVVICLAQFCVIPKRDQCFLWLRPNSLFFAGRTVILETNNPVIDPSLYMTDMELLAGEISAYLIVNIQSHSLEVDVDDLFHLRQS